MFIIDLFIMYLQMHLSMDKFYYIICLWTSSCKWTRPWTSSHIFKYVNFHSCVLKGVHVQDWIILSNFVDKFNPSIQLFLMSTDFPRINV